MRRTDLYGVTRTFVLRVLWRSRFPTPAFTLLPRAPAVGEETITILQGDYPSKRSGTFKQLKAISSLLFRLFHLSVGFLMHLETFLVLVSCCSDHTQVPFSLPHRAWTLTKSATKIGLHGVLRAGGNENKLGLKKQWTILPLPSLASGILSRRMRQASKTMVAGSNCIVFTTELPTTLIFSDRVAMAPQLLHHLSCKCKTHPE